MRSRYTASLTRTVRVLQQTKVTTSQTCKKDSDRRAKRADLFYRPTARMSPPIFDHPTLAYASPATCPAIGVFTLRPRPPSMQGTKSELRLPMTMTITMTHDHNATSTGPSVPMPPAVCANEWNRVLLRTTLATKNASSRPSITSACGVRRLPS